MRHSRFGFCLVLLYYAYSLSAPMYPLAGTCTSSALISASSASSSEMSLSASRAAMHPLPAEVMAWRYRLS